MTLNLKQIETLPAIFRLSYSIQKSKKESTTSNLLKYSTKTAKSQSIREISTYSNSRDILMCFTFESQGHRLITTIEKQEKPFYLREKKTILSCTYARNNTDGKSYETLQFYNRLNS